MYVNRKIIIFLVFIGIGIGLLIGSILNLVNPNIVVREYTDEEIKSIAKELGMIDLKEHIQNSRDMDNENKDKQAIQKENNEKNDTILFEIKKGEVSEIIIDNLLELGIIEDKEEFQRLVMEKKADKRFKYGIFEIQKNWDYEKIIEILSQ